MDEDLLRDPEYEDNIDVILPDYSDPIFPPSLFTSNETKILSPILLIAIFLITFAAVIINERFVVRGLQVATDKITNVRIKSVLAPLLVGAARTLPKFSLGIIGLFLAFSDIGFATVIGAIGFNAHITLGIGLMNYRSIKTTSYVIIVMNFSIALMSLISGLIFFNGTTAAAAAAICSTVLFLLAALLPLCFSKPSQNSPEMIALDADLEEQKTEPMCFVLPPRPPSILSPGPSLPIFLTWTEYLVTLTTVPLPHLTLACCDPQHR